MSIQLAIRDAVTERKGGMATVVFAGSVGTIIEWYDFVIYGTAACGLSQMQSNSHRPQGVCDVVGSPPSARWAPREGGWNWP
jgi:hypothetical protein